MFQSSEIKRFCTPQPRKNLDGFLDAVSPVELSSGEYDVYIQALDHDMMLRPNSSFSGPFSTEKEALEAGFKYLEFVEQEQKNYLTLEASFAKS